MAQQRWQKSEREDYRQAQRDWRAQHPDYWKNYRKTHPAYTQRNRTQSNLRWKQRRLPLQKRIDILQVTEKTMEPWLLASFAKQPRSIYPLLWAYSAPHVANPPP